MATKKVPVTGDEHVGAGRGARPEDRPGSLQSVSRGAAWHRIVDNATEIMYPISGWIPLLVCVSPSLQPRTPASPPPSGRGSAFPGQMSESFSPKQRDKWRHIVLH